MKLITGLAIGLLTLNFCGDKAKEKTEIKVPTQLETHDMKGLKIAYYNSDSLKVQFDYFKKEVNSITTDGRFNLKFLTSTSAGQILRNYPRQEAIDYIKNIEFGKRSWLRTHWTGPVSIIFSDSGKSKAKHATANSILIDDLSPNVEAFIAAGGNGIIFTDAHQAIDELKAKIKI